MNFEKKFLRVHPFGMVGVPLHLYQISLRDPRIPNIGSIAISRLRLTHNIQNAGSLYYHLLVVQQKKGCIVSWLTGAIGYHTSPTTAAKVIDALQRL